MNLFDAVILGLVQGIAEFLPISSSGHLILAREVVGLQTPDGLAVDAVLQLATALAVIVYFRSDLLRLIRGAFAMLRGTRMPDTEHTLLWAIVLGTLPAVGAGLMLETMMDTIFRNPHLVAWVLIAGSGLFLLAEYVGKRYVSHRELSIGKGLAVGLFQCLALAPGMSRSGATISGGMLLGLSREAAARFAFLLSIPIILGSGAKKMLELNNDGTSTNEWVMIGVASSVAFASGIASIHYLLRFLKTHTLYPFAIYRVALAILVFALL